eukprot:Gb_21145 [translate_table: standard]
MDIWWRRKCLWFLAAIMLHCISNGWIGKQGFVYANCIPRQGCYMALVSYEIAEGDTLDSLATLFQTTIEKLKKLNGIPDPDHISVGLNIYIPFPCMCMDNRLGFNFLYAVEFGYTSLSDIVMKFHNLSKAEWIIAATPIHDPSILFPGFVVKIPVNCSCGNPNINALGPFVTYVTEQRDNLTRISSNFGVPANLIERFNPTVNWSNLTLHETILFPAAKGYHGPAVPFNFSGNETGTKRSNKPVIIGVTIGGGLAVLLVTVVAFFYFCIYLPRREQENNVRKQRMPTTVGGSDKILTESTIKQGTSKGSSGGSSKSVKSGGSLPSVLSDITVEKSVEFSYQELASATNNFSIDHKIGEGGYGSVYYGVLQGQRVAIKKMNLQATREFLAELKVLTHVHHTNLVQLIGFCTVDSLFLIYEFVENGALSQHLHGTGLPPLSWSIRVQIALDAARGLEYIHEHTKPTYIHRDVKTSNILIDKDFRAKVADFGLTKLTESGAGSFSLTLPTKLVGTFGYMSPEYARFGDVSPKVDVYSFGVVLFEIISAKEAIVRSTGKSSSSSQKEDQMGLVTLFDSILKDPDGEQKIRRFVDQALGEDYPIGAVWKMALLAGACTQENPELRPNMRTAVVALMTLSSSHNEGEGSSGSQV